MKKYFLPVCAVIIIIALHGSLALQDYSHFPYSDGPEQGAAVRALVSSLDDPGDPIVNEHVPSSRYVPSTVAMALCVKAAGADVIVALKIFCCIFFLFFLLSAALFSRAYFDDPHMPPYCIAALLFLWGTGWRGSNAYMFSALAYNAYFSSLAAFSLALLGLYFQLRFLKSGARWCFASGAAAGALAFVNHPVTGSFFFISSLLIFIERRGLSGKTMLLFSAFTLPSPLLMALWPYYDFFSSFKKVALGRMSFNEDFIMSWQYLHAAPLLRMGAALAALPLMVVQVLRRRHLFLTAGFAVFSAIYAGGYLLNIALSERFIFFIAFVLQLTFALFLKQWMAVERGWQKKTAWCMAALLMAGGAVQAGLVYQEFIKPAWKISPGSLTPRYVSPNRTQYVWRQYFKSGDIVLSDRYSSWSIPVYTGAKVVAPWQTSPDVKSTAGRIGDVDLFYNPDTDNRRRVDILKKYRVSHILLNYAIDGRQIEPRVRLLEVREIAHTPSYAVFEVKK